MRHSSIPQRLLALIVLCLATSCNDPAATSTAASSTASSSSDPLLQKWTRSYEEEDRASGLQVFRPSDSRQWPASWFRMRYVFEEGGVCQLLILHPADAHYMAGGAWERLAEDPSVLRIKGGQPPDRSFEIIELTNEVLKLRPL